MEKELEERVVQKMNELFISHRYTYIYQTKNDDGEWDYLNSSTKKSHRILTDEIVKNHLNMNETIGVFSVKDATKFIAFDIDEYEKSNSTALRIRDEIIKTGISEDFIHLCKSGGKGIHLYLFLDSLCWQSDTEKFYRYILSKCNLLDAKIDYRPTHGLAIKMPLSRNRKNENYSDSICWFLDNELSPIKNYDYFLNINTLPVIYFKQIVSELKIEKDIIRADSDKSRDFYHKISNSYTYKQALELERIGLAQKGTRNESCLMVAKVYNTQRYSKLDALNMLNEWMYKQHKSNYTTKEKEWLKENKKIINWIYKRDVRFDLNKSINTSVTYNKEDLIKITKLKDLSTKKLAFGFCTHSNRYSNETFYFTGTSISNSCDIKSRSTISKSIKEIIESDMVNIVNLTPKGKQLIEKDEFTGELIFSKNIYKYNHIESDVTSEYTYIEDYVSLMRDVFSSTFNSKQLRNMFGRYQYANLFTLNS